MNWTLRQYSAASVLWLLPLVVVGSAPSPYTIIIDGGSTGSRLHIFEFVTNSTTLDSECVRRGSSRVDTPLSAFGRVGDQPVSPEEVALHLLPVFEYAAEIIPLSYHSTTRVTYQATAGMRLLDQADQEEVYDALYEGLIQQESFVFSSLQRSDIATLSGDLEGFYGAVAANYLKGIIDATMHTKAGSSESSHDVNLHGPLGALDMGGSSTQIVFLPESERRSNEAYPESCDANDVQSKTCPADGGAVAEGLPKRLEGDDFFSTSYLSYGADQFRERLWNTWVNDAQKLQQQMPIDSCAEKIIDNPCTFKGYEIEWNGWTLVGSGEAHECVMQVRRLIPHHEEVFHPHHEEDGRVVGGTEHPPLRGKFFAMSLYFFTLDSLRELSHPAKEAHEELNLSWPNPSIEELYNDLDGLCSRSWHGDLEDIQHTAHAYTRAEVLPHRCLESVYMVTLLRDGFGFHPSSRDITFTFLVEGSEVEWSLGMAIALYAQQGEANTTTNVASSHSDKANATYNDDSLRDAHACEEAESLSRHTESRCFGKNRF